MPSLVSLEVFNLCKCFIALVTFENTSLVQHWCKFNCKWTSFRLSQTGAFMWVIVRYEAYIDLLTYVNTFDDREVRNVI